MIDFAEGMILFGFAPTMGRRGLSMYQLYIAYLALSSVA